MTEVVVGPITRADIDELVERMRPQDKLELAACGSADIAAAVADSVTASDMCWSARINGELVCLFGCASVGSLLSLTGSPWMLGTTTLDRHPVSLMRTCRCYIESMRDRFPHLLNYVDERNVKSVRWLRRLGFKIHPAQPYGLNGEPFHKFEMR